MEYQGKRPAIHPSVYVAKGAVINGDVKIGEGASVWFNAVIRGDVAPTIIGQHTNVQDNATLHQSPDLPLILEDNVTVGHNAILHSCTVREGALIGMGAIVLDGAEVGEEAMVGAGCLVPPGKKLEPRSLYVGTPARFVRELTDADLQENRRIQQDYVRKAKWYKEHYS